MVASPGAGRHSEGFFYHPLHKGDNSWQFLLGVMSFGKKKIRGRAFYWAQFLFLYPANSGYLRSSCNIPDIEVPYEVITLWSCAHMGIVRITPPPCSVTQQWYYFIAFTFVFVMCSQYSLLPWKFYFLILIWWVAVVGFWIPFFSFWFWVWFLVVRQKMIRRESFKFQKLSFLASMVQKPHESSSTYKLITETPRFSK